MENESGREAAASGNGQNDAGILRREALKSLVTGLVAVPLLTERAHSQRHGDPKAESGLASERAQLFDEGWRFHRGDAAGAERPEFDDSGWRRLDLPHDWSVEDLPPIPESNGEGAIWGDTAVPSRTGPFDRYASEGKRDTGWMVGGTGWYRKRFGANGLAAESQVEIVFDGVYMNSDVWLNGRHLGYHPYGYTAFAYELTPYLQRQGENVLAVRVRNEGRNSRWYSGSGIYRHVWLSASGEVRVPLWGVYVTTPEVSNEAATVKVTVQVENRGKAAREVAARVRLLDPKGVAAGMRETAQTVPAGGRAQVDQEFALRSPQLWSMANPELWRAEVELVADARTVDRATSTFGIRKVEVDAERGLRINGEGVKLRGGCMHHGNGLLGAAAIDRAEQRRVELMKANGFNAIRCSHNPPSPAFLDACDRLGMLVIDEAFDCWTVQKNPQDYHLYFKDWWQRDIDAMVLRDRNHPSVIFWSIGNEIPERANPAGVAIAKQIVDEIHRLDTTRPVTAAIPFFFEAGRRRAWAESDPAFQYLNVGGYNYLWQQYESDHERVPDRVMMGTESFPLQSFENWQMVQKHAYVIGDFVWTGMDYLGESGIGNAQLNSPSPFAQAGAPAGPQGELGGIPVASFALIFAKYPWFNAYCGDIDLVGEAKPQLHYKRVLWGDSKLEMAVQRPVPEGQKELTSPWGWSDELRSWTWPGHEGAALKVRVYSSGQQVRLLLNGREAGAKPVSAETKWKAEFDVPYAPGELKAVALTDGQPIAELAFQTVGKPAKLRLRADRQSIRRDRNDLAYVTLEVVDEAGNVVPDAAVPVAFSISGAGELAGVGTADPKDVQSFRGRRPVTFHGKCLAIVRPTGSAGSVTLRAEAERLAGDSVVLKAG
ncbi:MAG TPA: glycoside hydrolase family 2 TIM barrel-domain containing protein [Bryobacteraceae bacterium]|nr:glycoside hydrolase family 2 TIM barrel-domain containing protein [Bryobacteraceae bacterium]